MAATFTCRDDAMHRRALAFIAIACPALAWADETWVPMTGAGIRAALEGRILEYANATQDFRASGKTLYRTNGRDSWGNWRVEGNAYCSQWPPSDLWACYGMDRQGDRLRFVGQQGDTTEAVYAD
jgi:hypothetical protein